MTGRTKCTLLTGMTMQIIDVEADASTGIPCCEVTGNLSSTVREARDRVRAAIKNSGIKLPPSRIVINFAPSNIRKSGTHFDLAMAMAIIGAEGIINADVLKDVVFIGELGLDGVVNPIKAVLPMVMGCAQKKIHKCIIPKCNIGEIRYVNGIEIIGVDSLKECLDYIMGSVEIEPVKTETFIPDNTLYNIDYLDIRGQKSLKRAMLIAAGGMHNILMVGPPGTGKTMTASRLVTIMPPPDLKQCTEISYIYSIAGLLNSNNDFISNRPFRNPHYSITTAAMVGGGYNPTPGEISLARHGVLFLDELNLFKPEVLEMLRVPLEEGVIRINRRSGVYEFPADFMLAAAINPCKCGYYPDRNKCNCSETDIRKHLGRISRPLMDRIDMCVHAPKITYDDMENNSYDMEYSSEAMRRIVQKVYNIQQTRFRNKSYSLNSQIPINEISKYCKMEKQAKSLIKDIYAKYDLSARAYHKLIKVARTIADIGEHDLITEEDICEAAGYKTMEAEIDR